MATHFMQPDENVSQLATVILPKRNEADLADLPDDVKQAMTFILVETIDMVLQTALQAHTAA